MNFGISVKPILKRGTWNAWPENKEHLDSQNNDTCYLRPFLLIWVTLNPGMDKWLFPL